MKKKNKKRLTALVSAVMGAAAVMTAGMLSASDGGMDRYAETTSYAELPEEFFTAITVSGGELLADGKAAGECYGGVSLSADMELTFTDGGRTYTLPEAQRELGVTVTKNGMGEDVITSPYSTARLIVIADGDFDTFGATSVSEQYGGLYILTYATVADAYSACLALNSLPSVIYAEPDSVCTALADDEDEKLKKYFEFTADDLGGWGVDAIGAKELCADLVKGKNGDLPEVIVAIVDTGVNFDHECLKDRIVGTGASFTLDGKGTAVDKFGHGSHCAGIVCSATPENVKILPVKALDDRGGGSVFSVYSGIRYAIDHGADVISLSLGFCGRSNVLEDAMTYAREKNVAVCVAAGNEYGRDIEKYSGSLQTLDYSITIGSMNQNYGCSYFSNYGNIDFSAPGEHILSCYSGEEDSYEYLSGTSMATPFAAACFADMFTYDPNFTVQEAYDHLKANALDICDAGYDKKSGWGMVNLRNFDFGERTVEAPRADKFTGSYSGTLYVTLSCPTDNADIYYTINGEIPTAENGTLYDGEPIAITETSTLRAVAVLDGKASRYEEYTYYIDDLDPDSYTIDDNGVLWEFTTYAKRVDLRALVEQGKIPHFTAIGNELFQRNAYIEEVILPDDVRIIGEYAFAYCDSLRTVTTNAEVIYPNAFVSCKRLEEVKDDSLVRVRENAFSGCERLKSIDCTSLTTLYARSFMGCSSLDISAFDTSVIETYGMDCFKDSGIKGMIDASAAGSIGIRSFENTHITGIVLSDTIEVIPDSAFKGCTELTYISAPGVKRIERFGLGLGKREYSPAAAVTTDIDFSALVNARANAFDGYVFDRGVTFSSLDANTTLTAFEGAYAFRLTLPTMKRLTIGAETFAIYADIIDLPAAERIDSNFRIGGCRALVFGGGLEKPYSKIMGEGGYIFTYEDNDNARETASLSGCTYIAEPAVYCPAEHYTTTLGQDCIITAYAVGEGSVGKWYTENNGILTEVGNADTPLLHKADSCGSFIYIFRMTDGEELIFDQKEIIVDVIDDELERAVIEENGFDLLDDLPCIDLDEGYRMYTAKFTAEQGGSYFISSNRARVTISRGGETVLTGGSDSAWTIPAELEAGADYDVTIILAPYPGGKYIPYNGLSYFTIQTADSPRKCISPFFRSCDIDWDDFDGDPDYVPDVTVRDLNRYLAQNGDFRIIFDEPRHYGINSYVIEGCGNYYGILETGEVELKEAVSSDRWYTRGSEKDVKFIPEEDGLYKLVMCPNEEMLEKAEEYGIALNTAIFDTFGELSGIVPGKRGVTYFKPASGLVAKGFSMTPDMLCSAMELKGGVMYTLSAGTTRNRYMLTRRTVLNECTAEYTKNYPYTGETVIPDISLYSPTGEPLEEGVDYTVRLWSNTEPGMMYAYIEGTENYPGCMLLTMTIDGGCVTAENDGTLRIIPNGEVKLSPFTRYKISAENDTFLHVKSVSGHRFYPFTISSAQTGFTAEADYNGIDIRLPAGTYTVYSNCTDSFDLMYEMTLRDDLIDIADADIRLYPDEYDEDGFPLMDIWYNGELLEYYEDYEIEAAEDGLFGIPSVTVWGIGRFAGDVPVEYVPLPTETETIFDGENRLRYFSTLPEMMYSWTPENSRYTFTIGDGYEQVTMLLMDDNGRVLLSGDISRWSPLTLDIDPDNAYILAFLGDNCDDLTINIVPELKDLRQCTAEWVKTAELGSPEALVTFMDGGRVLTEGTDYIRLSDCGQVGIGPFEYVFEGIGEYFGQVYLPVHLYTETMPDEPANILTEGFRYRAGTDEERPGIVSVMSFTSKRLGTAEYALQALITGRQEHTMTETVHSGMEFYRMLEEMPVMYASVFVYDSEGRYIGTPDTEGALVMEQGETRYIVTVTPYIWDFEDNFRERDLDIMINFVRTIDTPPATSETTTTTTTSSATTTTTTTATTSTSSSSTSTSSSSSSAASSTSPTTTVTTDISGELPETGMNVGAMRDIAAAMAILGAAIVIGTRKVRSSEFGVRKR